MRENSTAAVVGGKGAAAPAEGKSLLLSATLRQAYGGGGVEPGLDGLREPRGLVSGGQFARRQPEVGAGATQLPPETVARQREHRRPLSASEETMGCQEAVPYPQGYATLSAGMGRAGCGGVEESEPDVIPANFDPYSQGRSTTLLRNGSAVFRGDVPSAVSASVSPPPQPLVPARTLFGSHVDMRPAYGPLPAGVPPLQSWLAASSPSNTPPSSSSSSACTMRPAPTPSLIADSALGGGERQQLDQSPSMGSPPPAIVQVPTSMPSLAWERPHDLQLCTPLNGGNILAAAAQKPVLPPADVSTIQQQTTMTAAANPSSDFELNGVVIKERLMQARRLPESCV